MKKKIRRLTRHEIFWTICDYYPEFLSFPINWGSASGRHYSVKRGILLSLLRRLKIDKKRGKGHSLLKKRLALEVIDEL